MTAVQRVGEPEYENLEEATVVIQVKIKGPWGN